MSVELIKGPVVRDILPVLQNALTWVWRRVESS